jgi:dihydrofolate reductase
MTLDGVFDADTMDHWWPPADEAAVDEARRLEYVVEEYRSGDVYLLGRTTYEMLWPGWSTQTTGDGPGPILNRMKKYVVSTTLATAPWKESTIIRENVVEEITKLKQQPGKDMIIDGSASLVQSLQGTDLIDEYRFLVQPFIMGRGRRFFPDGTPQTKLRLVESKLIPFQVLFTTFSRLLKSPLRSRIISTSTVSLMLRSLKSIHASSL